MKTERITIMDVPFDKVTLEDAITLLLQQLAGHASKPYFVATPNPEMLLAARKNLEFKKILQNTDLNIPDGIGIIFASKMQGTPLIGRVTGTDLMQALCHKLMPETRIFLLGAAVGIAEKVKEKLTAHKKLNIVGTFSGSADASQDEKLRKIITEAAPELLFVAFGAPKQELWLARNLPHLHSIKVAVGVGGAFDFIAGVRKRAPQMMQHMGLEWLWRLIQQPSRIKRIFNAVVRFPITFLISRIQGTRPK